MQRRLQRFAGVQHERPESRCRRLWHRQSKIKAEPQASGEHRPVGTAQQNDVAMAAEERSLVMILREHHGRGRIAEQGLVACQHLVAVAEILRPAGRAIALQGRLVKTEPGERDIDGPVPT